MSENSPHNNNIKPDWKMPSDIEEGYKPVAFHYKNGVVELDYLHEDKCDYLSEYDELFKKIDYPFIDGFNPTIEDWKKLGFITHFE